MRITQVLWRSCQRSGTGHSAPSAVQAHGNHTVLSLLLNPSIALHKSTQIWSHCCSSSTLQRHRNHSRPARFSNSSTYDKVLKHALDEHADKPHREDPVVNGAQGASEHVHQAGVQLLLHRVADHEDAHPVALEVVQHLH